MYTVKSNKMALFIEKIQAVWDSVFAPFARQHNGNTIFSYWLFLQPDAGSHLVFDL